MDKFFENKFDFIVSIGEDCACTSYLRRCNLQHNSYPFDWLTNGPLENRIELICNDFKNFLNIEDLKLMQKPTEFAGDPRHDYYENTRNKLYFWHDFAAGKPLADSFKEVNEKYQRRIKRFCDETENSEKILFVWLSHIKLHSNEEIIDAYKKLKEKFYSKEVFLLAIENNPEESAETLENKHILIVHHDTISDDKRHHFDPTMGNKTNNLKIFKKIKLKTTFLEKIKRFTYSVTAFAIKLLPNRTLRYKLTAKINMFFYHAKL